MKNNLHLVPVNIIDLVEKLNDSTIKENERVCIPFDPDNRDYQEYLKWVAEGNTPQPAE